MSKIYSRKRFIIRPIKKLNNKYNKNGKINKKNKRKFIIIILIGLIILFYIILQYYIDPVFETLCKEKAKSIATIITNQESTKIMNKYQYEELYTIEKDEVGNVVIIKSNVVPINNMISDLTENIQRSFDKLESTKIQLKAGNLFGTYFFSGIGPSIPTKVAISGTLDTEIKSEFISKGINQTLHRIYVDYSCIVKIITPFKNYESAIINQVIIAEHVIVGNIPDSYYNLEGMSGVDDVLNVIE